MKKTILIFLFVLISISFISCSKNINVKDSNKSQDDITISDATDENSDTNVEVENRDNNIREMYLDYDGIKVEIDLDNEMLSEISEIENNSDTPDTELKSEFATIYTIYTDDSKEVFGTIYIGENGALYIKCKNNPNKDAAYKLADDFLPNNSITNLN